MAHEQKLPFVIIIKRSLFSANYSGKIFNIIIVSLWNISKQDSELQATFSADFLRLECVHILCVCMSLSHIWLFVTPWTVALQTPLSMEFSRQEHWRELPFPSPGDLPDPGIEPPSLALPGDSLLLSHWGSPVKGSSLLKLGIRYLGVVCFRTTYRYWSQNAYIQK